MADAELLSLCAQAQHLDETESSSADAFDDVVARLSALPAQALAGLQGKARLLLLLCVAEADGTEILGPEQQLISSIVRDILARTG